MSRTMTDAEVLEKIRDLSVAAKTIEGRLSMRDHIKHLLEREGLWQKSRSYAHSQARAALEGSTTTAKKGTTA